MHHINSKISYKPMMQSFKSVKMLSSSMSKAIVLIFMTSSSLWKCSFGASMEATKLSSLLAGTVGHYIEKLQDAQQSESASDQSSFPQTRGGYGGGGGGHGHGAITLDPVSIISLLALGAFLINNILQLLRTNMGNNMGRSLSTMNFENVSLPSPVLNGLNQSRGEPSFMDFFENVGSLYYLQPKKRHMCMKRVVCNYISMKETRENNSNLKSKIFDFMLSTVTKIVAPEMDEADKQERCLKTQKFCSDSLLKDARVSVEYKIYSQVSSWITKLAFNGLTSG